MNSSLRLLLVGLFFCLACAPNLSASPPGGMIARTRLASADTTIRYQLDCGAPAGQQIESCVWDVKRGAETLAFPNAFQIIVAFTGAPNDSVHFTGTATTVRRGKSGPAAAFDFWGHISDVAPPSGNVTVTLCTKAAPACN